MSNEKIERNQEKLSWETPVLEVLGEIGDVAGGSGLGADGVLPGS